MATYRLKVWTGPVAAVAIGRKLRRAKLRTITGTEHVYVTLRADSCAAATLAMRARLRSRYGKDFGLRAAECGRKGVHG